MERSHSSRSAKFLVSLFLMLEVSCAGGAPAQIASVQPMAQGGAPLIAELRVTHTASATPQPPLISTATFIPWTLPASLTSTSSATPKPTFVMCSPLKDIQLGLLHRLISDGYHPPPMGSDARHQGVDFANFAFLTKKTTFLGLDVLAVLPGRVAASVTDSFPFGNLVIIETSYEEMPIELSTRLRVAPDQSLYLLYAHMQLPPVVKLGEYVSACQAIGKVGHTGNTLATHLHFETRIGPPGAVFDGFSAFTDAATQKEKANYRLWRISGVFQHFNPMLLLDPQSISTPTPNPE